MLSLPQPDFEPSLALHLGAFQTPEEAAAPPASGDEGVGAEVSDQACRARQLLTAYRDRFA